MAITSIYFGTSVHRSEWPAFTDLAGLAASGIEEAGHGREAQPPTAEAIKQRKKREKDAAKKAALGIEKFTIEVAGVFKSDLLRVMKAQGINNRQDIHQRLLINLIAADFETQARMLRSVTTPLSLPKKCHANSVPKACASYVKIRATRSFRRHSQI